VASRKARLRDVAPRAPKTLMVMGIMGYTHGVSEVRNPSRKREGEGVQGAAARGGGKIAGVRGCGKQERGENRREALREMAGRSIAGRNIAGRNIDGCERSTRSGSSTAALL
jgi:hypothetical protein